MIFPSKIILSSLILMFGGMLLSTLHGLLCIKFKANHIISGVVQHFMALTIFLTTQINSIVFGAMSDKFHRYFQ